MYVPEMQLTHFGSRSMTGILRVKLKQMAIGRATTGQNRNITGSIAITLSYLWKIHLAYMKETFCLDVYTTLQWPELAA